MLVLGAVSILVGFVGSLTGLGGASILIPLLTLSGIPVKEAIASAMVSIIATSSGSAASYVRERIANIKLAMFLEMFTISGAIIGATITVFIAPVFLYFFLRFVFNDIIFKTGDFQISNLPAKINLPSGWALEAVIMIRHKAVR